jgi:hypothetical protein
MDRKRLDRIIAEEVSRLLEGRLSEAMTPAERSARRRELARKRDEARREAEYQHRQKFEPRALGRVGRTAGPLSAPDMMGYQQYTERSKAAYIEPGFQQESGIYTVEDVAKAVRDGTAMIWTAGSIGGGVSPAYTVVPAGAEKSYNAMTGEPGYPYVYNDYEKDPATGKTNWDGGVEATVYTGAGSFGSLGGPRPWPPRGSESILGNIKAYFNELVPLPLLTMKKKEAEEEAEEKAEGMSGDEGGEMGPLSESRWAKLAGLMAEGKGDSKAGKKFSASTEGLSKDDIKHAKKMGLERKGDTLVGTVDQHKKFYNWVNATSPSGAAPFDPDELDVVDEGAPPPGMTGARGSRMPPKPVDPKSGPPGKEDLEKTKKAGPFEGKRRK